jgi:uncharacterized membrane protein YgcG
MSDGLVTPAEFAAGIMAARSVRPEYNKNWLNVVITYSKDRKYDGLSTVPQTQDQKTRFQFYKYHVGSIIRVCQGPHHTKESVDMVESQCAILLCSESAQIVVVDFVLENGWDPLKGELFAMLEAQVVGSASGDLTQCKKFSVLHCDDLPHTLMARMTKGHVGVDLPSVLNLAKSDLKFRLVPLDSASHALWILNLFRDKTNGRSVDPDLAAIRETAEHCMSGDGVWIEQMDPIAMLRSVASCSQTWDNYYNRILSRTSGGGGGRGTGGGSAIFGGDDGPSGGGQAPQGRPGKRQFNSGSQAAGRSADRLPFDPFVTTPS